MKSKKISRILVPISGIMSFMLVMGVMVMPAFGQEKVNDDVIVEENVKTDYATYINDTTEKSGVKLYLNSVTASKNKISVTTKIECPEAIDEEELRNCIFSLTVKNTDCELDREQFRKIDDKTLEITFDGISFKGMPEKVDLRFDVIIPQFNLNGWVNSNVDLTKNYDKIIEKDILIKDDKAKIIYNKLQSDVLGTTIYKEKAEYDVDTNYEEEYSDSESTILIKYDDKIYSFKDGNQYYDFHGGSLEAFTNKALTYDAVNKAESISLIPVICNLKNKEADKLYDDSYNEESDEETVDNVTYEKKFKFSDGKDGEISKIERLEDKIKVYCNADTEKKSLLMAIGIEGWSTREDENYNGEVGKIIYKNPNDEAGYIIEFTNVHKNDVFNMYSNSEILGQSDKFEFGQETKIK